MRTLIAAALLVAFFSFPAQASNHVITLCQFGTMSVWTNAFAARRIEPKIITWEDPMVMRRLLAIYDAIPPPSKTDADRILIFQMKGRRGFVLFIKEDCAIGQALMPYTAIFSAFQQAGFRI